MLALGFALSAPWRDTMVSAATLVATIALRRTIPFDKAKATVEADRMDASHCFVFDGVFASQTLTDSACAGTRPPSRVVKITSYSLNRAFDKLEDAPGSRVGATIRRRDGLQDSRSGQPPGRSKREEADNKRRARNTPGQLFHAARPCAQLRHKRTASEACQ